MFEEPRPCERQCKGPCGRWLHHSRFRSYKTNHGRHGTKSASVSFHPICKQCENTARDEKKNADRPKAIIENRAKAMAQKEGVPFKFIWMDMNYRAFVPEFRAMLTPDGLCQGCGHNFMNERDIQIEHLAPPRFKNDWARQHTRNLRLMCASCNGGKGTTPYEEWLDNEEQKRLSHKNSSQNVEAESNPEFVQPKQLPLFFELP